MTKIALGIMACHSLAYWYAACERSANWAFIRDTCPDSRLSNHAYWQRDRLAGRDAHRTCALAIVLAWRDRVQHE